MISLISSGYSLKKCQAIADLGERNPPQGLDSLST